MNSSPSVAETIFSFELEAGKSYLIDGVLEFETAAADTGIQPTFNSIPANSTCLCSVMLQEASSVQCLVRRDNTEISGGSSTGTPARQLMRFTALITTTDTAGTMTLDYVSELNTRNVTVHAGSFADFRDVTESISILADDAASTDNTNYTAPAALAAEAAVGERLWITMAGGFTSSAAGVGLNWRLGSAAAPAGGVRVAAMRAQMSGTTGAAQLARDATALNDTNGPGSTERPFFCNGHISGGTSAANDSGLQFKINDGDTGTVTLESGSFVLLEEVELQA
jgi:hypothetical protein